MRVVGAVTELTELLGQRHAPKLRLELRFDGSSIGVKARFAGPGLSLSEIRPEAAILLEKEEVLRFFQGI
jgi:hypothetical protein